MMIDGIGAGLPVKHGELKYVSFLSFQNHTEIRGNNFLKKHKPRRTKRTSEETGGGISDSNKFLEDRKWVEDW